MSQPAVGWQRVALGVEYDGIPYSGWQTQPHAPSVQDALNSALSVVANQTITSVAAGRTDAGVHATGQVVHFDTTAERDKRSWVLGVNSNLPRDISVLWAHPVPGEFHARFAAVARSYRYIVLNRPVRSALERNRVWWIAQALDAELMQAAANCLLGQHDFSAFRASSCQAHSPVRTMTDMRVVRSGDYIHIECRANAFLHHMVRNIVGSLVKVGRGEADAGWLARVLDGRDRTQSGVTAPAEGLTLTRVEYPAGLLPDNPAED